MAGSVNKVILVGNLGQDPEIRSFPNGGRVANFSIATSERWKDKATGEQKEVTQWHRIAVKNENLVGIVEKYVKKGSKVYVEGRLEHRKYTDKDGQEKYISEVVLPAFRGELTLLDSRGGGGREAVGANDFGSDEAPAQSSGSFAAAGGGKMDDEIPF